MPILDELERDASAHGFLLFGDVDVTEAAPADSLEQGVRTDLPLGGLVGIGLEVVQGAVLVEPDLDGLHESWMRVFYLLDLLSPLGLVGLGGRRLQTGFESSGNFRSSALAAMRPPRCGW